MGELEWSEWVDWNDIVKYVSDGGVRAPAEPGVYQVKFRAKQSLIYIGESNKLERRVNFLMGRGAHRAGERIRANEDISKLEVRWATVEQHKATETELLETHRVKFGSRPKYNKQ